MLLSPPHLLLTSLTAALLCPTASGDRLGPAVTRLGLQLAAQLEKTAAGAASAGRLENFVLSPYSAHAALSQLALGARGVTAAQLEQLLGLPAVDSSHLHANFTAGLLRSAGGRRQLRIANLMALSQGFEPRPSYTAQVRTRFQAEVQQFDFAGNVTASVREMNRYVRRATEGRIPVLLSPQSLGSNTLMVLLNAVYFKALWQHRFDPRNNFFAAFERSDGRKVRTTFMSCTMTVRVRRDRLRRVTMLELPYDNDDGATSLLVILPFKNRDDADEELEYRDAGGVGVGNYQDFNNIMQRLAQFRLDKRGRKVRVLVQLPRFRIRHRTNLKPVLQSLGVTAVFSPRYAGLDGIAAVRPPLFVSEALQQVVLEVDEEGTEAAAATAVIKTARSGPFWFTADRPFVFAVYDYRLGAPLFLGKVEDPTL
jgi:serine protease inhibitor